MERAARYIEELAETAENMGKLIKEIKQAVESKDYDLERLMKNVDADFMDMKYKIDIANRLAKSHRI